MSNPTTAQSIWMATIEFQSSEASGFGATPETAVKALVEAWTNACTELGRGDPVLVKENREDIKVVEAESGKGYVLGVADTLWYKSLIGGDDARFDAVFSEAFPRTAMPIGAETHSDDHQHEVDFDAESWFEQASDDEIIDLAKTGWGGDVDADEVALFFEGKHDGVTAMFAYLATRPKMSLSRDTVGYECNVTESDALAWVVANRPKILPRLATVLGYGDADELKASIGSANPTP
jgi:hypothetical protein